MEQGGGICLIICRLYLYKFTNIDFGEIEIDPYQTWMTLCSLIVGNKFYFMICS